MHACLDSSGNPLHPSSQVSFKHAAHFVENEAFGGGDEFSASPTCGGAVHIGKGGQIIFSEFVSFEDNWVGNGGRGGAICNMGEALFRRRSFFTGNEAQGEQKRDARREGARTAQQSPLEISTFVLLECSRGDDGDGTVVQ